MAARAITAMPSKGTKRLTRKRTSVLIARWIGQGRYKNEQAALRRAEIAALRRAEIDGRRGGACATAWCGRRMPSPARAACSRLLGAAAGRIEAGRALPADVVAALHEARMFRLLLPRSLGGDELHLKELTQVTETIASADASTAWCMGQGAGCAMSAAYLKPEVARRLFGPADAVLAWGAGIQGKARRGRRRLSRHGQVDVRQRLRQRDPARGPQLRLREGRHAEEARRRQPGRPHRPARQVQGPDRGHVAHARPQGHGELHLPGHGPVRAGGGDHRPGRARRSGSRRVRSTCSPRRWPMRRPSAG